MIDFLKIYYNKLSVEDYLLFFVCVFTIVIVLLIIFLFIGRLKKIAEENLINSYNSIINKIVFPILFSDISIAQIIQSTHYHLFIKKRMFVDILLKDVVKLHINYSGDCNARLEKLYREYGLMNMSFTKLKSRSLNIKCEGVRELSEMNIMEAYPHILKLVWHKNNTLKLEALIGLIRLKGIKGLIAINDYPGPINDWIQLNLIYEINNSHKTSQNDFSDFLKSTNESLVLFGLRLVENFNQKQNITLIKNIESSATSYRMRDQARRTLEKLSS